MALTTVQQGLIDTQTSIPMTYGAIGTGNATTMKNRIINGAMVIDQRNAGASITANNGAFPVDRFRMDCTQTGKGTIQQTPSTTETGYSVRIAAGFTNYVSFTSSSAYSVLSTDEFTFTQNIEGYNIADLAWGTSAAKTVTLSFWVQSSLTGTFGGSIANVSGSRSYPFSYLIPSANTWTQISVTIPGDTAGSWINNNGLGLRVWFGLGCGSNYSGTAGAWSGSDNRTVTGAVSVVGVNAATWNITGVQLEVGSSATGFEYRSVQQELYMCQRYYQNVGSNIVGVTEGANAYAIQASYYCPMRTSPSITSRTGYYFNVRYAGSDVNIVSPTISNVTSSTLSNAWMQVSSSGLTSGVSVVGRAQNSFANVWSAYDDFLAVSAEL